MNASSAAGATAPQPASATSGTPEPQHEQEAGAVEPAATSASTPAKPGQQRRTPARSTVSTLGRLTAATVIACSLNGAAAYVFVQSDAMEVRSTATEQQASLDRISRTVSAMPTTARRLGTDRGAQNAHLDDAGRASSEITAAASRAAAGPAQFNGDIGRLSALSASYTRYVSTVERARVATGAAATTLYTEADRLRTTEIEPVLGDLSSANAARSDGAEVNVALTIGFLGLTTVASLAASIGGAWWLARRTKRMVNPGLFAATALTAVTSGYAVAAMTSPDQTVNGPFSGPAVLLGGLTAAGLAWYGYEQRRKEYR
ncbi:hypothetical protein [Mobilicoccus caccae]|uniref:Integral membrane protein n=1 Tax=Mobilicoccus caccae TaxID=1859295 RepID=A0ABQ6ITS5_9MICO|nr:hypothetical protein [Mobilicoccus caccae]GMA41320.1 hypothetical protein GCM10025883_33650 [Mobilicoccus caccae]